MEGLLIPTVPLPRPDYRAQAGHPHLPVASLEGVRSRAGLRSGCGESPRGRALPGPAAPPPAPAPLATVALALAQSARGATGRANGKAGGRAGRAGVGEGRPRAAPPF